MLFNKKTYVKGEIQMRPILVLAIIIIFIASAYYDLNIGSIPEQSSDITPESDLEVTETDSLDVQADGDPALSYEEIIVEPGHTVYGIVQALHDHEQVPLTVQAEQVVNDFEALNPEVGAHQIIVGEAYRFPIYKSSNNEDHS